MSCFEPHTHRPVRLDVAPHPSQALPRPTIRSCVPSAALRWRLSRAPSPGTQPGPAWDSSGAPSARQACAAKHCGGCHGARPPRGRRSRAGRRCTRTRPRGRRGRAGQARGGLRRRLRGPLGRDPGADPARVSVASAVAKGVGWLPGRRAACARGHGSRPLRTPPGSESASLKEEPQHPHNPVPGPPEANVSHGGYGHTARRVSHDAVASILSGDIPDPQMMKAYLDKYVIGQEQAKITLSGARSRARRAGLTRDACAPSAAPVPLPSQWPCTTTTAASRSRPSTGGTRCRGPRGRSSRRCCARRASTTPACLRPDWGPRSAGACPPPCPPARASSTCPASSSSRTAPRGARRRGRGGSGAAPGRRGRSASTRRTTSPCTSRT